MNADAQIRAAVSSLPVPVFETTAFTNPKLLAEAVVAIVTTAGLHPREEAGFVDQGDQSFRLLPADGSNLTSTHFSPNWDRTGLTADINVVFPIDRLHEMAAEGVIGAVSPVHISFMGALDETMSAIRLDSGPAAAAALKKAAVDVILLTPV